MTNAAKPYSGVTQTNDEINYKGGAQFATRYMQWLILYDCLFSLLDICQHTNYKDRY